MVAYLGLGTARAANRDVYLAARPLAAAHSMTNEHVVLQLFEKYGPSLATWLLKRLIQLDTYDDAVITKKYRNSGKSTTLHARSRKFRKGAKRASLSESYIGCYFCKLLENEAGSLVIRLPQGRLLAYYRLLCAQHWLVSYTDTLLFVSLAE
jgi:hypothetical protein